MIVNQERDSDGKAENLCNLSRAIPWAHLPLKKISQSLILDTTGQYITRYLPALPFALSAKNDALLCEVSNHIIFRLKTSRQAGQTRQTDGGQAQGAGSRNNQ
jgi:hypothetical protein